jgi:hypothetical protein
MTPSSVSHKTTDTMLGGGERLESENYGDL